MNKYLHFSQFPEIHAVNARRLHADINTVADLDKYTTASEYDNIQIYIAADMLLLDNNASTIDTNTRVDIEVYLAQSNVNDKSLVTYVQNTFGLKLPTDDGTVALLRLNSSCIRKLGDRQHNKSKFTFNISPEKLSVSSSTSVKSAAFSTKAKTLRFFEGLTDATIEPGLIIRNKEWNTQRDTCLTNILNMNWPLIIARSSSLNEDSFECSNAGAFESVANVNGSNKHALMIAIEQVFSSFHNLSENDEVFLQPQISNPAMSGVCTTRVVGKNAPYYVINYDDESGSTDSVTSGFTNALKTIFIYRQAELSGLNISHNLKLLLIAIKQLESFVPGVALDIEFIVDANQNINIVQIRPLVGDYHFNDDNNIHSLIESAQALYSEFDRKSDGINLGDKAIFGVMPDANPAELIGIKPKPLAFSLYQHLITDDVVTNQRREYGYRDVRPVRHMIKIGGGPYVNVRSSFNSFTPASIEPAIAEKLINAYLNRLSNNISLHDKVEFDIVATTWFPGVDRWLEQYYKNTLSKEEIDAVVVGLKQIFVHALSSIEQYNNEIEAYQPLFNQVINANLSNLQKAYKLIDICHHYGCKPFAHLARSAFVAVTVLKGLLAGEIITKTQYDDYLHSIESVSSKMEQDACQVKSGDMQIDVFYENYGHLRPGTYDICSEAYFENYEKYLYPFIESAKPVDKSLKGFDTDTQNAIESYLNNQGIKITFSQFDRFARAAISGREYGKFKYTRFLSYGLHHLCLWGQETGIHRDDLAYLTVNDIHELLNGNCTYDIASVSNLIKTRKNRYALELHIELPDLITSSTDFSSFYKQADKPNFITGKNADGPLHIIISSSMANPELLQNSIVMIDSADPGYDWLFGCSIAGLITKYGGANSHMAIRCAELNIPAAIGIGDVLYSKLSGYKRVRLDCASETIKEA